MPIRSFLFRTPMPSPTACTTRLQELLPSLAPSAEVQQPTRVVPVLFAYGRHISNEDICQRAIRLLEELPAEKNHILRQWQDCGLKVQTAADSQALIQLKRQYCDRIDCLRCRFGYEYLKGSNR